MNSYDQCNLNKMYKWIFNQISTNMEKKKSNYNIINKLVI